MSDEYKAKVKKLNAVIGANDLEAFLSFYTDDVRWVRVGEKSAMGREELRGLIESLGDAPPPSNVTLDVMIAEGVYVVAFGHLVGKGDDGETAPRAFCDVYRFRGDEVAEHTSFLVRTGPTLEPKSEAQSLG